MTQHSDNIKDKEIVSTKMNEDTTTRHPENYQIPPTIGGGAVVPEQPNLIKLTIKKRKNQTWHRGFPKYKGPKFLDWHMSKRQLLSLDKRSRAVVDYCTLVKLIRGVYGKDDELSVQQKLLIDDLAFMEVRIRDFKFRYLSGKPVKEWREKLYLGWQSHKRDLLKLLGIQRVKKVKSLDDYLEAQFAKPADQHSRVCEGSGSIKSESIASPGVAAESDLRTPIES